MKYVAGSLGVVGAIVSGLYLVEYMMLALIGIAVSVSLGILAEYLKHNE